MLLVLVCILYLGDIEAVSYHSTSALIQQVTFLSAELGTNKAIHVEMLVPVQVRKAEPLSLFTV